LLVSQILTFTSLMCERGKTHEVRPNLF
jgi:hypothetical protein